MSKRAVSRRRLRQSYPHIYPAISSSDLHFNLGAAREKRAGNRGRSRNAPRANYKLRANLIPRRLTVNHLAGLPPTPLPRPRELSLADLIINSAFRSGYITITGPSPLPSGGSRSLSSSSPPPRWRKNLNVSRGINLF